MMLNRPLVRNCLTAAAFVLPLASAQAELLDMPTGEESVLGTSYDIETRYGETTLMLAQMHQIGYHELLSANPDAHTWMPGEGARVHIPKRYILPGQVREGIVVNLAELRLYYFEKRGNGRTRVHTYPISAGRVDWVTPLGLTKVVDRLENPTWYPPKSVIQEHLEMGEELPNVVPPGKDNPLGRFALMLDVDGYFIHGTNREQGIGMRVTHGCIRMRSDDIAKLIHRVPIDAPVRILSTPIKVGLQDGLVYMEAHPRPLEEFPMPVKKPVLTETDISRPFAILKEQLPVGDYVIYWEQVVEVSRRRLGIPVIIGWDRDVLPFTPHGQPELLWHLEKPPIESVRKEST